MIKRELMKTLKSRLDSQAGVVLLGPRQVGKTTLALEVARERGGLYLDLENPADLAKLSDPAAFFGHHMDRLLVLDEIHRVPGLFPILRGVIDQGRRMEKGRGRFLLLGSASMELMRQSGESLAGRVAYLELCPLNLLEVGELGEDKLWLGGGFPESVLETDEQESFRWRQNMVSTYLEREIPQFGPRIPSSTLRRFWTMLAHQQGGLQNASKLAASLEVSAPTISRYTDLLVDLLLVRRLQPYHVNVGKRLVKSPKVYLRDSGWTHALLNVVTMTDLLGHPVAGASWEGFVLEQLLQAAPDMTIPGFYRTSGGAEVDLVLELPGGARWAIEIKRSQAAKPERGFHEALQDLRPERAFVVRSGTGSWPLRENVLSIGLPEILRQLREL